MTAIIPVITDSGIQAVFNASGDGLSAVITEIAVGDGAYIPDVDRNSLANEISRTAVAAGKIVDGKTINVSAIFDGPDEFWIREVGFFLEDGTLLAVYSHPTNVLAFKNATTDFLLSLDLILSTVPDGSVTISEAVQDMNLHLATELVQMANASIGNMIRHVQAHDQFISHSKAQSVQEAREAAIFSDIETRLQHNHRVAHFSDILRQDD
ncbi:MAG: phage tail protein [Pseudomonadota bacterium]